MTMPQIQPPDYGNALKNLIGADQAKLKRNNLIKEGENWDYKNSPEVRDSENKLLEMKQKNEELLQQKQGQEIAIKSFDYFREKVQATKALVDIGKPEAHAQLQAGMKEIGFPSIIPDLEVFYTDKPTIDASGKTTTTKTFDTDLYNKWYSGAVQTATDASKAVKEGKKVDGSMKTLYNGDKTMQVFVPNGKDYTPAKGWSFDKAEKEEKKEFKKVYKDGKVVWEEKSKIGGMETEDNVEKDTETKKTYRTTGGKIVKEDKVGNFTVDGKPATPEQKKNMQGIGSEDTNAYYKGKALEDKKTKEEQTKERITIKAEDAVLKADEELTKGRAFTNAKGDKGEYNLLSDKTEGKKYVDKYNRNAERAGLDERYMWVEDLDKVPADWLAGLLPFGKDGKAKDNSGWVKVDKSEMEGESTTSKKTTPKEEIEAMKSGEIFWVDGKQYKRK